MISICTRTRRFSNVPGPVIWKRSPQGRNTEGTRRRAAKPPNRPTSREAGGGPKATEREPAASRASLTGGRAAQRDDCRRTAPKTGNGLQSGIEPEGPRGSSGSLAFGFRFASEGESRSFACVACRRRRFAVEGPFGPRLSSVGNKWPPSYRGGPLETSEVRSQISDPEGVDLTNEVRGVSPYLRPFRAAGTFRPPGGPTRPDQARPGQTTLTTVDGVDSR